ncbi:hypothetical protein QBC37DRAFT_487421 [Rhypophila decipiens]|uniref:Uncharacterized protein n=1 Tax=Rhypophila decipiens TaxID=261697 RepID=A0AAN7B473_9PEZI|nr:hypothetical protein QBC37DRAFT_487421 [Rhypophila decipiens]
MATNETEAPTTDDWENIGPLTTVFSPPPLCATKTFFYDEDTGIERYIWKDECFPPMTTTGLPGGLFRRYFSPGLCPSGWYNAQDYSTMFHGGPSLVSGESVAICCPSGYMPTFWPITGPRSTIGVCESALQSKVTAICDDCTGVTVLDTTNPVNGKHMTASEGTLMIRWQASDLPILSAAPAGSSPTRAPSTTSDNQASSTGSKRTSATRSDEPSTGSTQIGSGNHDNPPTGLSTAAKAGIGGGIAALVILAILVLAIYLLRRKKQKKIARTVSQDPDGPRELHEDTVEKAELPVISPEHLGAKELDTEAPPRKLATSEPPTKPELPGEEHAVLTTSELPADVHGGEALQGYHMGTPKGDYYPSSPAPAELDGQVGHSQPVSPQGDYHPSAQATGPTSPVVSEIASTSSPVAFYSPTENIDEYARLQEEETRLATRRTVLHETLSLIQEDERLRAEQEAVRRRLEELRKGTKGV